MPCMVGIVRVSTKCLGNTMKTQCQQANREFRVQMSDCVVETDASLKWTQGLVCVCSYLGTVVNNYSQNKVYNCFQPCPLLSLVIHVASN